MVVYSLWRFKKLPEVRPALITLINDPPVALHAMSSLRRAIGSREALPYLREVQTRHAGRDLAAQARKEAKKVEKPANSAVR